MSAAGTMRDMVLGNLTFAHVCSLFTVRVIVNMTASLAGEIGGEKVNQKRSLRLTHSYFM